MTPAALLMELAGLSHREAAEFLRVRIDTVKSWSAGRNAINAGALAELQGLIARQERAASETLAQMRAMMAAHGSPDEIEVGYPADDHEARTMGWPCVGAWSAMFARVIAAAPAKIVLVPRGSTPGTAAAADAAGR